MASARARRAVVIATVAASCAGVLLLAQNDQQPTFRAGVEAYQLEVSVLDKERRPIRGLTQADFIVLEDGQPQDLLTFQEIEYPEREGPLYASEEIAAPDVVADRFADRRLFVLVLDDFGMFYGASGGLGDNALLVGDTKEAARQFVLSLGPKDFAAVVLTRDTRYYPDFTNMVSKLTGAIDQFRPPGEAERSWLANLPQKRIGVLPALNDVLDYLDKMPQHSKTIVYVGNPSMLAQFRQAGYLSGLAEDVMHKAQRYGVSISSLDVSAKMRMDFNSSLKTFAENTGGYAAAGRGFLEQGVAQILSENQSYYLLSYQQKSPQDGRFHTLQVKVNRPDAIVRTRSGYTAQPKVDRAPSQAAPYDPAVEAAIKLLPAVDSTRPLFSYATARPGALTVVTELSSRQTAARGWTNGADVAVDVTGTGGRTVATAQARIDAGARGVSIDVPVTDADGPFRVNLKVRAAGEVLEDSVGARADGTLLGPSMVYRGPLSPRAPVQVAADLRFGRNERIRAQWRELEPVTRFEARLLRRTSDPVPFTPTVTEVDGPGGKWLSTELPLAQLAPSEYLLEMTGIQGNRSDRHLIAFRVVQ